MRATCSRVQARIGEYLSGSGGDAGFPGFRPHLDACPECSSVGDFLLEARSLAAPLDRRVEAALLALREGVLRAVQDEPARLPARPFPSRAWTLASAAAAAGLLLTAFLVAWGDRGTGAGAPPEEAFRVLLEDQSLVIHWPENGDRVHTVYRSTTPADFSRAKVAVVRGDRWVDSDPQAPGTAYFYLVD